jgi:hypothetical protein
MEIGEGLLMYDYLSAMQMMFTNLEIKIPGLHFQDKKYSNNMFRQ